MNQTPVMKVVAEFPAYVLRWIRIAEPEFKREKIDIEKYNITVLEQNNAVTVILKAGKPSKGQRGNIGSLPGFEVEINKVDGKVIRSNYIR